MLPTQLFVLADDLTGAAEIAALGFRHGLRARVIPAKAASAARNREVSTSGERELLVIDTDSRLDAPEVAARKVSDALARLGLGPGSWCFKKTDSVLRGPVAAELRAFASVLRRPRVLLVPCNPSMGRTIRGGEYFIAEVPIDQTSFSRDPHHPAHSAKITALLHGGPEIPVQVLPVGAALPPTGVIVGEAQRVSDLESWAARVDSDTAAAGGAEFFSANLRAAGFRLHPGVPHAALPAPTLVISGTASTESRDRLRRVSDRGIHYAAMPANAADRANWSAELARALEQRALAIAAAPETHEPGEAAAASIRASFAALVSQFSARSLIRHLVIEGGATAAEILTALGVTELEVVHEWAQGVITLRPTDHPALRLTLKPGSYAWPEGWWAQLPHSPFS